MRGASPPSTSDGSTSKFRVSFDGAGGSSAIVIQLDVSSESGCDFAFISDLDNTSATSSNGYYTGSAISGEDSVTVTIPVPSPGSHFIDIGYQKDNSATGGSDCAWFKVIL
jgi:hypothetical protein